MKTCRTFLLSLLLLANTALANTFTTDLTDLWWNAIESGWGVTLSHQGDFVFLTFFVYGTDNKPKFYTGQATYVGRSSSNALIFSGPLFETTGPWLGESIFNVTAVKARQVGMVTLTSFVASATLEYSVDGVQVRKPIVRQTLRQNNMTGNYLGAIYYVASGCAPSSLNNTYVEPNTTFSISNSATTLQIRTSNPATGTCTYTGTYEQAGRMGRSEGSFSCSNGAQGSYTAFEIEASYTGMTGRLQGRNGNCSSITGKFGGITNSPP